jgi:hypothetical protein
MFEFKSVLDSQHGGTHYKEKGIQPIEYANANDLSFFQGNVVKYVTRYKDKKGVEDVKKAIHYLQMILEFEYNVFSEVSFSDTENQSETFKNPFSGSDISQEELKKFVESVDNHTSQDNVPEAKEELWYPLVKEGENPWIEYDGSGIPVEGSIAVEVLWKHEREDRTYHSACGNLAVDWDWSWDNYDGDIVAYRIVD